MNSRQEQNRLMVNVVIDTMETVPETVLNEAPNLVDLITQLKNKYDEIRIKSEIQALERRGVAMAKGNNKLAMVVGAVDTSSRIQAFALNTGNVILQEEMQQGVSHLMRKNGAVAADICDYVYQKGTELLTELAVYGVTAAKLESLKANIIVYTSIIPKTRIGINERRIATLELKALFEEIFAILIMMDLLVRMLKFSNSAFYELYFNSRKLVKPSSRVLAVRGFVSDELGLPLAGVTVRFLDTKIIRKSTLKGNFSVKNLAEGVHTVLFNKAGYGSLRVAVAVTATERTELKVSLTATPDVIHLGD